MFSIVFSDEDTIQKYGATESTTAAEHQRVRHDADAVRGTAPAHCSPRVKMRICANENSITTANRNMLIAAARPMSRNSKAVW